MVKKTLKKLLSWFFDDRSRLKVCSRLLLLKVRPIAGLNRFRMIRFRIIKTMTRCLSRNDDVLLRSYIINIVIHSTRIDLDNLYLLAYKQSV